MKKAVFFALIAVFVVGLAGVALAGPATTVVNGEMKASYMVWPKIVVEYDPVSGDIVKDTVVTIFNDGPARLLHCFWMDEYQQPYDFGFEITRMHTVWFKASDGSGMGENKVIEVSPFDGNVGELKCFAVNDDDLAITANQFTGTGTIFDFIDGTAIGYNAYGFKRAGGPSVALPNDPLNPGVDLYSELFLSGAEYDACPAYLIGTFMLDGATFADGPYTVAAGTTELTLVPCDQDLREQRLPIYTKFNLTVWDEDETSATGAYICFKCWVETTLTDPPVTSAPDAVTYGQYKPYTIGFKNFTQFAIQGTFATVKIVPAFGANKACKYPITGTAAAPTPVTSPARPGIGLIFGSTSFNGFYATNGSILQGPASPWVGAVPVVKYDVDTTILPVNKR